MLIVDAPPELPLALDTNIFTHLRNKQPYVLEKIKEHILKTTKLPVLPSLTIFESNYGVQKSLATQKITDKEAQSLLQAITILSQNHSVIPFDQKSSEIAAYIYARLPQKDRNKHWRDLFIVATVIAHNYGLATQNKKDRDLISKFLPPDIDLRISIWKP